jgi:hypothetical protein
MWEFEGSGTYVAPRSRKVRLGTFLTGVKPPLHICTRAVDPAVSKLLSSGHRRFGPWMSTGPVTCSLTGALEGIRTPNLLIRSRTRRHV